MRLRIVLDLPDETMVEGHLLDDVIAESINARIADMPDIAGAGRKNEHVARRAHVAERRIRLAAFTDDVVRFQKRVAKRLRRRRRRMFEVRLRRFRRGDFARKLARLMRAHSVGDDENMTSRTPNSRRRRRVGRERILIVATLHPHV